MESSPYLHAKTFASMLLEGYLHLRPKGHTLDPHGPLQAWVCKRSIHAILTNGNILKERKDGERGFEQQ
jgi:hypothetical protein